MAALINIFVGNPLLLAAISAVFFVAYFLTRNNPSLRAKTLLAPAIGWLAWALWEWGVQAFSPGANIRVDLLLIMPIMLILTSYGVVYLFRSKSDSKPEQKTN